MVSNLSSLSHAAFPYPALDSALPFATYIDHCQHLIATRRPDLQAGTAMSDMILRANSPYELTPLTPGTSRPKIGALLLHGLLDSPFSLRDIGQQLQTQGILCRAILLPGHGTIPQDLLHVTYQDWLAAMRYGIESLKREVEQLYLIGYSTGALLALYHAIKQADIAGIILLAPAIKIKAPVDIMVNYHQFKKIFTQKNKDWMYREPEMNYVKYQSIPFNPIHQVATLASLFTHLTQTQRLSCPMMMIVTRDDETITTSSAVNFFAKQANTRNQLLYYTSSGLAPQHPQLIKRHSRYPTLQIRHLSHIALPFAPHNPHYGQQGDYCYASRVPAEKVIYGAYNRLEVDVYEKLFKMNLLQLQRRELTYNPDFDFMITTMLQFMLPG